VAALVGDQRADDREVLELRGQSGGEDLADLDAWGGGLDRLELAAGGLAGLEVPQVHVTGPTAHPEDDQALVLLLELALGGAQAVPELQARQRQGRGPRQVSEEVTPIHPALHVQPPVCAKRPPTNRVGRGPSSRPELA